jgi:hypothetical protein
MNFMIFSSRQTPLKGCDDAHSTGVVHDEGEDETVDRGSRVIGQCLEVVSECLGHATVYVTLDTF